MNRLGKLDELVGTVDALLAQLPLMSNAEVEALRDRVDTGIFEAWTSIGDERPKPGERTAAWILMGLVVVIATAAIFLAKSSYSLEDDHGQH
jgi:hypothetical protein